MAAAELPDFDGFLINAGGDVIVHGSDQDGRPWRIGVKNPAEPTQLIAVLNLTDGAVCTSGGYERPASDGEGHHIVAPDSGASPSGIASVTVVSASAMVSDALSTAAFLVGRDNGLALLKRQQADGMIIDASGNVAATAGLRGYL